MFDYAWYRYLSWCLSSGWQPSVSPTRRLTGRQNGALSLVGIVEIVLSLVESFIELKYFHDVAPPALLCHKEPAALDRKIPPYYLYFACSSLVLYCIRDRWLPCTERSYYRRPYAIKNQLAEQQHYLGPDHECSTLLEGAGHGACLAVCRQ